MDASLIQGMSQWAEANREVAYLAGFCAIVAIFYALFPYSIGLNCATSRGIPFKHIDVWAQVKKQHRLVLCVVAIVAFTSIHLGLGAPLLALVLGSAIITALTVTDYIQIFRENRSAP